MTFCEAGESASQLWDVIAGEKQEKGRVPLGDLLTMILDEVLHTRAIRKPNRLTWRLDVSQFMESFIHKVVLTIVSSDWADSSSQA